MKKFKNMGNRLTIERLWQAKKKYNRKKNKADADEALPLFIALNN